MTKPISTSTPTSTPVSNNVPAPAPNPSEQSSPQVANPDILREYRQDLYQRADQRNDSWQERLGFTSPMNAAARQVAADEAVCKGTTAQRLYEMNQAGEPLPREARDIVDDCDGRLTCATDTICGEQRRRNVETITESFNYGITDKETQAAHEQNVQEVYESHAWLDEFGLDRVEDESVKAEITEFGVRHEVLEPQD